MKALAAGILISLICITSAHVQATSDNPALPTAADYIETHVKLPHVAAPIADYARYYTWENDDHLAVSAIYLLAGEATNSPPGRYFLSDDLPMIIDGSCRLNIYVVFKLKTNSVDVYCRGRGYMSVPPEPSH